MFIFKYKKYSKLKWILLIVLVGLVLKATLFKKSTKEPNSKEITKVLNQAIDSSLHPERFFERGVVVYDSDLKEGKYIIQSSENSPNSISLQDPVIKSSLELHNIGECFINRVNYLNDSSFLYSKYKDSIYFQNPYFYTSCPIIVNDKPIGYVEVILYVEKFGILSDYNFVVLAAYNVSKIFTSYL